MKHLQLFRKLQLLKKREIILAKPGTKSKLKKLLSIDTKLAKINQQDSGPDNPNL